MSPLSTWKLALKTLKAQLMAQTSSFTLGETQYYVTHIMNELQEIIVVCPGQWNLVDRTHLHGYNFRYLLVVNFRSDCLGP